MEVPFGISFLKDFDGVLLRVLPLLLDVCFFNCLVLLSTFVVSVLTELLLVFEVIIFCSWICFTREETRGDVLSIKNRSFSFQEKTVLRIKRFLAGFLGGYLGVLVGHCRLLVELSSIFN